MIKYIASLLAFYDFCLSICVMSVLLLQCYIVNKEDNLCLCSF